MNQDTIALMAATIYAAANTKEATSMSISTAVDKATEIYRSAARTVSHAHVGQY